MFFLATLKVLNTLEIILIKYCNLIIVEIRHNQLTCAICFSLINKYDSFENYYKHMVERLFFDSDVDSNSSGVNDLSTKSFYAFI